MRRIDNTIYAIVLLVVAGAGILLALQYTHVISADERWRRTVRVTQANQLEGILFREAVRARLVFGNWRSGSRPQLVLARCDEMERPDDSGGNAADSNGALLTVLCTDQVGKDLRTLVAAWNAASVDVGVRDDSVSAAGVQACAPQPGKGLSYYVTCDASNWKITSEDSSGAVEIRDGPSPDPAQLSAFGQSGVGAAFHDWVTARAEPSMASADGGFAFHFSAILQVTSRPLHIQIAGTLRRAQLDGHTVFPAHASDRPAGLTDTLVDSANPLHECQPPPGMTCLIVGLAATGAANRNVQVDLDVASLAEPSCPTRAKDGSDCSFQAAGPLVLTCTMPKAGTAGTCLPPIWKDLTAPEPEGGKICHVFDRSGVPLADDKGFITKDALDAGLGPVIGLGPEDTGSLLAALFGGDRRTACDLHLTISLATQILAEQHLRRALTQDCHCDPEKSRAEIVLLDAQSRPGEIVVVATWPVVEHPFHVWDMKASLAAPTGRNNPVRRYGWQESDPEAMPGSLFKLVTSVAAIDAVEHGDDVAHGGDSGLETLLSGLPLDKAASFLGVTTLNHEIRCDSDKIRASASIFPAPRTVQKLYHCVTNSSDAPFNELSNAAGSCGDMASATVGLCEALATSSNLWFAGVAFRIDGPKLLSDSTGWGIERTDAVDHLQLAAAATRMFPWPSKRVMFAGEAVPDNSLLVGPPYRPEGLRMEPISMDAEKPGTGRDRRNEVALAGFGQNVYATPLAITTAYASLASGLQIRPHLNLTNAARAVQMSSAPLFGDWHSAAAHHALERLRAGLAAVVASGGTAGKNFIASPLKFVNGAPRLFAKTGTATPNADFRDWNSGGFAGWIDKNVNTGISDRLAFSCTITWTRQYGADSCGILMRDLLRDIDTRQSFLR
jgi:hypothetical protein